MLNFKNESDKFEMESQMSYDSSGCLVETVLL